MSASPQHALSSPNVSSSRIGADSAPSALRDDGWLGSERSLRSAAPSAAKSGGSLRSTPATHRERACFTADRSLRMRGGKADGKNLHQTDAGSRLQTARSAEHDNPTNRRRSQTPRDAFTSQTVNRTKHHRRIIDTIYQFLPAQVKRETRHSQGEVQPK